MTAIEKQAEFEVMEKLDEDQIVKELQGHVIDRYFYEDKQGFHITWAGIKWMATRVANMGAPIDIVDLKVEDKGDYYEAVAIAKNLATGERRYGATVQSKAMKLHDGSTQPDMFAYPKAFSKAQRNAIRIFLPEKAIEEGYKEWKKKGSIEQVFGDRIKGDRK